MRDTARALSAALDREFIASIQSLKVLATSASLDKGHLSEFYGEMKKALAAYVKRMTKVGALQWLSTAQASAVIESLKAWLERL